MEGKLDESTIKLIKSFKNGEVSLKGFLTSTTGITLGISASIAACYGIYKVIDYFYDSVNETKEKVSNLMDEFNSALKTANENAKTIDSLADRYAELSKGVNNLGENISLTTEEYAEYNSIVNQIADISPTLVQGYTNEGNAILSLKGNVDELKESYKEAQKEAYNLLIAEGKDADGNDILKNASNIITGSSLGAHDWGNVEKIKYLDKIMQASASTEAMQNLWDESLNSGYSSWFEEFTNVGGKANIKKLTDKELADIKKEAKILKQQYQAEIDSAIQDTETLANAYLMTNEDYDKLSEQSKNVASIVVNSLNEDIVSSFGENKENVGYYVDEIVQILLNNPEVKKAMLNLFTLDTSNLSINEAKSQIDSYINIIAKALEEDPIELKARLGFEEQDSLYKNYNEIVEKAVGKFTSKNRSTENIEAERKALDDFAKENSINTQDEIAFWNQCLEESKTAEQAMKKYLAKPEQVTKELSKSGMIDQINSMSDAFSVLDEIYADVKDGETFDFTNLDTEKFEENFKNCKEEYIAFIEAVSTSPNNLKGCQAAFNNLTEAYLRQNGVLEELTEENSGVAIAMLTNMGVSNAQQIIQEKLTAKNLLVKNSLKDIDLANQEVSDSANDTIEEMLKEGVVSGTLATSMYNLYVQENILNNNKLDVKDKIKELGKLALSYGIVADSAKEANEYALYRHYGGSDEDYLNFKTDQFSQAIVDKFGNLDTIFSGSVESNKSSSEKDEWLEKYKKELSLLQDQLDQELITEREFYDKSEALLNQYLKDTPEHIQKYEEEISDAEKSLHSDWINAYQAEHDKLEQSLEDGKISAVEYCQQLAMLGQEYYGIFDSLTPNEVKEEYYALAKEAEKCGENVEEYIGKNGSKAVQKYGSYVKEAKEAVRELKEQIKSTFDNAINAVISVLDSQISDLQDSCDRITDSYKEQQKAIEKQIKGYEKQIEAIEKQKDALEKQKDSLNEQLEAIEDATSERERQLSLEEALYNLNRLSSQKNKMVIDANGQKVYQTDNKAIASAREDVQKANEDIQKAEIEKQIKGIEKQIDLLDDQIDSINEIIDKLNDQKEEFDDLIEATEDYYNGIIKGLENYQKQWQKLIDASEKQEALKTAEQLGITEGEILGMSATAFANVKDKYDTLLKCIYNGNDDLVTQFATLNGLGTDEFVTAVGEAGTALSDFRDNSKAYLEEALKATTELLGAGSASSEEQKKGQGESQNGDTSNMVGVFDTSEMLISTGFETFSNDLQTKMDILKNTAIIMANEIVDACRRAKEAMEEMSGLSGGGGSSSWSGFGGSNGTGASFADGTGRLSHAERNSLVGEIAPELVVDTKRGTTQLFTKPTMVDLPEGAIVYNGEQTKRIIDNKESIVGGKAHASGTISNLGMTFEEFALKGAELRQMLSEQGYSPIFDKTKMNYNTAVPSVINNVTTNNNSTSISSSIGDIYVQGVQNPSGLAEQIVKNMPNLMIQKLNRRL